MQNIADDASASFNKVKEYLNGNPRIAAMLAVGGGTALLGGGLTAREKERTGESKGSRRLRILRNALLTGAAGAGTVGLASSGYDSLANAVPANSETPATELAGNPLTRVLAAVGLGGAGLSAGGKLDTKDVASQIRRKPGINLSSKTYQLSDANFIDRAAREGHTASPKNSIGHIADRIPGNKGKIVSGTKSLLSGAGGISRKSVLGAAGAAGGYFAPDLIAAAYKKITGSDA